MNKRGIGAIIAMVLIILLVVGSIALIWAFIKPVVEKTGEGAGDGQFSVVLQIEDFEVEPNGDISLTVSRGASGPDLPALKVLIFDGTTTTTFTTEGLVKMQTKKLTLSSGGLVKEISVAPVFESSGDEKVGNIGAKLEFSNKEVMKNHGAVAWWRFEGNADDEVGGHDGSCTSCPTLTDGKFGKGYNFNQPDKQYFNIQDKLLDSATGATVSMWINPQVPNNQNPRVFSTKLSNGEWFTIVAYSNIQIKLGSTTKKTGLDTLVVDDWNHILVVVNSDSSMNAYINGVSSSLNAGGFGSQSSFSRIGGGYHSGAWDAHGIIDEPMIFDRALTAEEVSSLYNIDLS